MNQISQKTRYALRAIFELAKRVGQGPIKVAEIAKSQDIPPRFLEVILGQLKHAGFVESYRGVEGGYVLSRRPGDVAIGDIIRMIEGPVEPVACLAGHKRDRCNLYGSCVFLPVWQRVQEAVSEIYDNTTFESLVEEERKREKGQVLCYSI